MKKRQVAASVKLLAVVAIILSVSCRSPRSESVKDKVDTLFAEWSKPDSPGCGIGITCPGLIPSASAYSSG
jgi:hypothetical protein